MPEGTVTEWLANISVKWVLVITGLLLVIRMTLPRARQVPRALADSVAEFVESALIAIVLVFLVIRPFVVQAFYIPSGSMRPTLMEQDRILVNKFVFRLRGPHRGEVVVFKAPPVASPEEKDFIKRVIGLPGQEIEVKPDTITIDGKPALQLLNPDSMDPYSNFRKQLPAGVMVAKDSQPQLEQLAQGTITLRTPEGRTVPVIASKTGKVTYEGSSVRVDGVERAQLDNPNFTREGHDFDRMGAAPGIEGTFVLSGGDPLLFVLKGSRLGFDPGHVLVNNERLKEPYIAQPPRYEMKPYVIPAGDLFVMGDNRNDSNDSHAWGPLDMKRIVGKAMFIFWPPNRMGLVH